MAPSQIVPQMADEDRHLASESSSNRVLHAASAQQHRGRSAAPVRREAPNPTATGPSQLCCWDIRSLPSSGTRGLYYHLYLMLRAYSRKTVGWEVETEESGERKVALMRRTVLREEIAHQGQPFVLDAGIARQ